MIVESCVRCGKQFLNSSLSESGRCIDCEKCGKFVMQSKYDQLMSHAKTMRRSMIKGTNRAEDIMPFLEFDEWLKEQEK